MVSAALGLLGFNGDILSWLWLIVFLHWHLGIWGWNNYKPGWQYLVLFLLNECSVLWFPLSRWILGECGSCVLPGKKLFVNTFSKHDPLVCSQGIPAALGCWDDGKNWGMQVWEVLSDLLGVVSERKDRPQQISAIQLEMRWVGLNLEEWKDRYGSPVCVSLAGVTLRLGGGICLG